MNKYEKDLSEKIEASMDLKNWPHRFTHDGRPYKIGEESVIGHGDPIMAAPMICMDCNIRFISGIDSRPPDPCPARTQKTEMKRILS